jgi:hypothetical protein
MPESPLLHAVITNRNRLWHAGLHGGSAGTTSIGHSNTNEQPKPREEIKRLKEELEFWKVVPD